MKAQGRIDDFVRVAERLLFHRPGNFAVARELAVAYIARRNPRLALAKLQAPLKAAPRDPANVTLLAEAMAQLDPSKAVSVWRELAELHDVAGRTDDRDAAVRAALALDPTDGETRELAARWGVATGSAVKPRSSSTPPPMPSSVSASGVRPVATMPRDNSGPLAGVSGLSGLAGLTGMGGAGRG